MLKAIKKKKKIQEGLAEIFIGFTEEDAESVLSGIAIHPEFTQVTGGGISVIIASTVIKSALVDASMTMFDKLDPLAEVKAASPDDHSSGYS